LVDEGARSTFEGRDSFVTQRSPQRNRGTTDATSDPLHTEKGLP